MAHKSLSVPLLDGQQHGSDDVSGDDQDPILESEGSEEEGDSEQDLSEVRTPREWTCEGAEPEPLSTLPTVKVCAACGQGWDEKEATTIPPTVPRRHCLDNTHEGPLSAPKPAFTGSYQQMKSLPLDVLRSLAQDGHPWAQCLLGRYYESNQDKGHAMEWYEKSAAQDFDKGLYHLGCMERKLECFEAAAKQGHVKAQYETAKIYGEEGPAKNLILEYEWALKAAQQDHAKSQLLVAQCLLLGEGTTEDPDGALMWTRRAAECGDCAAMLQLAQMHETGVWGSSAKNPPNLKETIFWYQKALSANPSPQQREIINGKLQALPRPAPKEKEKEDGLCSCCVLS